MVPEPAEGHPLPDLQPLQVADHQDCVGPAAADHGGPLPLQHAWLPGEEAAGGLRGSWGERGRGQMQGWPPSWTDGVMDGWVGGGMVEVQRKRWR